MFDFVHKHKRLLQGVLLILILPPFVFWGIDSYNQNRSDNTFAVVGDYKISETEFLKALKSQQDRMQSTMGRNFDPKIFDKPEVRSAILENLINQRILVDSAIRSGLAVSDDQLREIISSVPDFQVEGKFSNERYEALIRNQGFTPLGFEAELRQELLLGQMQETYVNSEIASKYVAEQFYNIAEQGREINQIIFGPEQFLKQVKVTPEAISNYYAANQSEFQNPEQVKIEYVLLNAESQLTNIQISNEEARKYYEENIKKFEQAETRAASHILIGFKPDSTETDKAAAKEKANQVLKQAQSSPKAFAVLAKQHSQDSGSAAQGGDLGSFPRGAMVKAFDDTVFSMNVGEIKGPIQTEFGFHIIKLSGINPAKKTSFDEVKRTIEQELKRQTANKKFAEVAENFSNMVFEQADSLQPVAEKFKLQIQRSPWLSRKDAQSAGLNNEKFLQTLFSSDALQNRRNTEAVEITPGVIISARVIEHKATAVLPLKDVSAEITKRLQKQEASAMAIQEGKRLLAALQEGKNPAAKWSTAKVVIRQKAQHNLSTDTVRQIFTTGTDKLPSFTGAETPDGSFNIFKVVRVVPPPPIDDKARQAYIQRLRQLLVQEEMGAYLASLKQKTKIKIYQDKLQKTGS